MKKMDAEQAKSAILKGKAPADIQVKGGLDLSGLPITHLPEGLTADSLDLSGCKDLRELPATLKVRRLDVSDCTGLRELPAGFSCYELLARRTNITTLPADLKVEYRLNLEGCEKLQYLPQGLAVGSLILRNCVGLRELPEGLSVYFLDISGCTMLQEWPEQATLRIGHLNMRGCTGFTELPNWLGQLAQLDLRGCVGVHELPDNLKVSGWIDLADTQVRRLPEALSGVQLRWRSVLVDERVVFEPEKIRPDEVMAEGNAERRRVLIERMGYEQFLAGAHARTIHQDFDAGGLRELVLVPFANDEPLVCLSVRCPSTGRQYMLRVPPATRTCHQAAAWIAGFDNPDDYHPLIET